MILEGVVVVPRWSATSGSVIVVLFVLELLSQAKVLLHLVLAVLVERAWAFEDFLVLLVIVTLGARLINGGEDVFWPTAAILVRPVSSYLITAAIAMIVAVIGTAVIVTSVVGRSSYW